MLCSCHGSGTFEQACRLATNTGDCLSALLEGPGDTLAYKTADGGEVVRDVLGGKPRLLEMFVHDCLWRDADSLLETGQHHVKIVKLAGDRDDSRHEINWGYEVRPTDGEHCLGGGWHARIARHGGRQADVAWQPPDKVPHGFEG
jgi:hypothetical protein